MTDQREAAIASGTTALAGVVGWPVSHSLSPAMHSYWIARHALDAVYIPLPVREASFSVAISGLSASGFRGVNVTIPHKRAAFGLCDTLTPTAQRTGAVNTMVFRDGHIQGDNTDGAGFLSSLIDQGADPRRPALILGAGGAAMAIAVALQDAGAQVTVASRDADSGQHVARTLGGVRQLAWDRRECALADFGLLVNATAGGMTGKPALEMRLTQASAALVVADIVYSPRRTVLLKAALARGLTIVEGIEMLIRQAVPGFSAWFGVVPVADAALRDFVLTL